MESQSNTAPLIVILGETSSGKSALSMRIAQQFNGEIIAADSRTVFREMDIGTAKPTRADQLLVPHHLLNITTADTPISVFDFKERALKSIADIAQRGKVPMLVGGTGLYIDAVIYDFSFRNPPDPIQRQILQQLSITELQQLIKSRGLPLPVNVKNPRHLIRSIETNGAVSQRGPLRPNTLLIGIQLEHDMLVARIRERVDLMLQNGLLEEAKSLGKKYGWDAPALQATSYKAVRGYLQGSLTLERAKEIFMYNDLHLARRQRIWFRNNKSIQWVDGQNEAVDLVTTFLNN